MRRTPRPALSCRPGAQNTPAGFAARLAAHRRAIDLRPALATWISLIDLDYPWPSHSLTLASPKLHVFNHQSKGCSLRIKLSFLEVSKHQHMNMPPHLSIRGPGKTRAQEGKSEPRPAISNQQRSQP